MKLCRMPTEWANAAAVMSDVWSVNSQKNVFFPLFRFTEFHFLNPFWFRPVLIHARMCDRVFFDFCEGRGM